MLDGQIAASPHAGGHLALRHHEPRSPGSRNDRENPEVAPVVWIASRRPVSSAKAAEGLFLSNADLVRLAASGSDCILVQMAPANDPPEAPADAPQPRDRGFLSAIALGAFIGATTGLSISAAVIYLTGGGVLDMMAMVRHALTFIS